MTSKQVDAGLAIEYYKRFKMSLNLSELAKNPVKLRVAKNDQSFRYWQKMLTFVGIDPAGDNQHYEVSDDETKIELDFECERRMCISRLEEKTAGKCNILYVIKRTEGTPFFVDGKKPSIYVTIIAERIDDVPMDINDKRKTGQNDGEIKATLICTNGVPTVYVGEHIYVFSSRRGRPEDIIKMVASEENIGKTFSRKDLGNISESLNKVFSASLFTNELLPFADIDKDTITVHKHAYLTNKQLEAIKQKSVQES